MKPENLVGTGSLAQDFTKGYLLWAIDRMRLHNEPIPLGTIEMGPGLGNPSYRLPPSTGKSMLMQRLAMDHLLKESASKDLSFEELELKYYTILAKMTGRDQFYVPEKVSDEDRERFYSHIGFGGPRTTRGIKHTTGRSSFRDLAKESIPKRTSQDPISNNRYTINGQPTVTTADGVMVIDEVGTQSVPWRKGEPVESTPFTIYARDCPNPPVLILQKDKDAKLNALRRGPGGSKKRRQW